MASAPSFSLRSLFRCVFAYACLFSFVAAFSVPTVQFAAALSVVTIFVLLDLRCSRSDEKHGPLVSRFSISVAYYCTAYSISTIVGFAMWLLVPQSPTTSQPPLCLLEAMSGKWLGDAIGPVIATIVVYYGLYVTFSTLAFLSSLCALRQFRSAKWFAIANCPGTILFVGCIFGTSIESA